MSTTTYEETRIEEVKRAKPERAFPLVTDTIPIVNENAKKGVEKE